MRALSINVFRGVKKHCKGTKQYGFVDLACMDRAIRDMPGKKTVKQGQPAKKESPSDFVKSRGLVLQGVEELLFNVPFYCAEKELWRTFNNGCQDFIGQFQCITVQGNQLRNLLVDYAFQWSNNEDTRLR